MNECKSIYIQCVSPASILRFANGLFLFLLFLGHVYKVSKQTKTNNKTGDDMYVKNASKTWRPCTSQIRTWAKPHFKNKNRTQERTMFVKAGSHGISFLISDIQPFLYRESNIFQSLQIYFLLYKFCITISIPILLSMPFNHWGGWKTVQYLPPVYQICGLRSEVLSRNQHCATQVNFRGSQVLYCPQKSFW